MVVKFALSFKFMSFVTGDALGEAGEVFKQLAEIKDNLVCSLHSLYSL